MHLKKILCPFDFSSFSEAANEYASILAQSTGAEIIYLHVALPDVTFSSYAYVDLQKEAEGDRKRLEAIKPTVDGIKASYEIAFGTPSTTIAEFADEHSVDLVVMGTHGRTGWRRVTMGSVAEAVIRNTNCPVLAIKSETKVPQTS
jgi:nucleotide-binding universal stress UspA family protein